MIKNRKLKRGFYIKPTIEVAKNLLGKYLIHKFRNRKIVGKIVETEAYIGPQDKASHAHRGKITERNKAEYMIGGHIYIYLVYGMHWQLNISTANYGQPECVLIRAVEPTVDIAKFQISNLKFKNDISKLKFIKNSTNGPGKLCKYLKLDKRHYGLDLAENKEMWLEDREDKIKPSQIVASRRIGIDYAGPYWAKRKWRFYINGNHFVSKL